ncbi:allantoate amidohydrolase [Vreelandella zhaodongensis]|uniref:Allantoate amidohydrolase n=1 Tax=Vreelandella zhaodongensis TaxID=1176240 RepID=A0ABX2SU57_VREZH|nr:allantoate amidohydrolase [Halomonas zhaodongensis]NYS45620.1 allantoate amidohydrolase [Halomonas zhaodongensis]
MALSFTQAGQQAWKWLEDAAKFSETDNIERDGVTRRCATPEHRAVLDELATWMKGMGMSVRMDNAANLIGRYASPQAGARTLLLGSHQDTVPNGGKYDGMMGVILPLALVSYLYENAIEMPFHIDVVAFSDEEGTRFSSTLLGSKVLAGTFEPGMLEARDDQGITLGQALADFGCDTQRIDADRYLSEDVIAFIETHIEQGPQLEQADVAVGVVSAITGIERHEITVKGMAGHAGTVPMDMRQDALVGAAGVIQLVDKLCKSTNELVGVVGKIENAPNGVNVIPQTTTLSIELRSPDDAIRRQARTQLLSQIDASLKALNLGFEHRHTYEQPAVQCAEHLIDTMQSALNDAQIEPRVLFSGAGHDGLAMADLCDIGMLFVRCRGGISHHPSEAIKPEDLGVALEVLLHTCQRLAQKQ